MVNRGQIRTTLWLDSAPAYVHTVVASSETYVLVNEVEGARSLAQIHHRSRHQTSPRENKRYNNAKDTTVLTSSCFRRSASCVALKAVRPGIVSKDPPPAPLPSFLRTIYTRRKTPPPGSGAGGRGGLWRTKSGRVLQKNQRWRWIWRCICCRLDHDITQRLHDKMRVIGVEQKNDTQVSIRLTL